MVRKIGTARRNLSKIATELQDAWLPCGDTAFGAGIARR
jgi:hypothetical protein